MPITSSRSPAADKPDLSEAFAASEEMSRILAEKRKKRGARAAVREESDTLTDFADEAAVAGVYSKFNAKRAPQSDADDD